MVTTSRFEIESNQYLFLVSYSLLSKHLFRHFLFIPNANLSLFEYLTVALSNSKEKFKINHKVNTVAPDRRRGSRSVARAHIPEKVPQLPFNYA